MKTKITAAILFVTVFATKAIAQDSFKPEASKLNSVPETIVKVFSRTETFFGAAFTNSNKDAKNSIVIPNSSVKNYTSKNETFFGVDLNYSTEGAQITNIVPYSPAAVYNFKKEDIITAIGNIAINSAENYRQAMEIYKPGEMVVVKFNRKGTQKQRTVQLDKITVYKEADNK